MSATASPSPTPTSGPLGLSMNTWIAIIAAIGVVVLLAVLMYYKGQFY